MIIRKSIIITIIIVKSTIITVIIITLIIITVTIIKLIIITMQYNFSLSEYLVMAVTSVLVLMQRF